jgi:hypothetical protein
LLIIYKIMMNSEPLKERQKMLQCERQQRCRQLKRQRRKENVPSHSKKRKDVKLMNHQKLQRHVPIHEFRMV